MSRLRSVDDQIARMMAVVEPLAIDVVPVEVSLGRVLAADVTAVLPVPPFDNSAMDGFALRFADVAGLPDNALVLPVSGDVPAGAASTALEPGTAQRVMTGAPLPAGADTVVPVEQTDQPAGPARLPTTIRLTERPMQGRHIRREGEDLQPGASVLVAGTRLGPAHIAAAVSTGHGEVAVYRRPRVAVISTGDELVAPGVALGPGQIPDSNGPQLAALAQEWGAVVTRVARVADTADEFGRVLRAALDEADLVITTGGVSVGAFEVVRQSLEGLGRADEAPAGGDPSQSDSTLAARAGVEFTRVAMQPGKPQGFGRVADSRGRLVPLLALPGNPVSSFVSFHVLARPVLAVLAGLDPQAERRTVPVRVVHGWSSPAGKRQYIPLAVTRGEAGLQASAAHRLGSGSHLIASLHLANCLGDVPPDVADVVPGDIVEVIPTSATSTHATSTHATSTHATSTHATSTRVPSSAAEGIWP
ncbi:molybdopterin molybdotransferase MoeA [Kribbia dieselivorans]|uniref:molybdopterin molybdotransferase MoeA n=1 Tax=Kribbia dieselivorans TaxID=331526 RepID=UPI00083866F2|nr:gephyrin-like molybdotransferase Glp [Kribbia dieselivorans]